MGTQPVGAAPDSIPLPEHIQPSLGHALRVLAACLACWIIPLVALGLWRGKEDVLFQEGIFFSKAAVVTLGGAYSVLPYVAQQAVEYFHWLTPAQMIDGLGLAETLPGPLIKVLQFVGFMAGWHKAADLGLWGAVLGALTATYFTFMPCFLWIFLGAPYIEEIRKNRTINGAMGAITAAVVGVVLNLAVWFADTAINCLDCSCWNPANNRMRRNVLDYDGARRNDSTLSDSHAIRHNGSGPNPDVVFDHNSFRGDPLFYEGAVRIFKDMVHCDDLCKWGGVYAVSNLYAALTADDRVFPDQAVPANLDP